MVGNGLPKELKQLISQEDFNSILAFATAHLADKGNKNISLHDGILKFDTYENLVEYVNFANLVKDILCEERDEWEQKTKDYFDKLKQDHELEQELLSDFEKAKEYLTVRLHSAEAIEQEPYESLIGSQVQKIDIPGTYTLLALDLPSRFHLLQLNECLVWGVDTDKLFEIAHQNILNKIDDINTQQHNWDGATFYTLFDRNYSAAYCIDFGNNCSNLIGAKGSLVAFPTRGSVLVHPITGIDEFNTGYNIIVQRTLEFFADDPGPITENIYWFYENEFMVFKTNKNDGEITYNIPDRLGDLLNRK